MHAINVQYAVSKKNPSVTLIKRWVNAALVDRAASEVTIRIVDIDEITRLNEAYRHKQGKTNVLAFSYGKSEVISNDALEFLGDIIICSDVVNREAKEQNKSLQAHWAHMVIHGTLHLLGYDHVNKIDADVMETKEIAILAALKFNNPYFLV